MDASTVCPVCRSPLESGVTVCGKCGFKLVGQTEQFEHIEVDEMVPENFNSVEAVCKMVTRLIEEQA